MDLRSPRRIAASPGLPALWACLVLASALGACSERAAEPPAPTPEVEAEVGVELEAPAEPASAEQPDGPSIIVITIDTLRRDHLSLYGYERPTSPHLQALAGESIVFEHAVSTSPWTKPSTASLFTGLHPSEHGAHGELKVRSDVPLLAGALAERGYATAAFSGNPYVSAIYGLDRGFDHFDFQGGDAARDYVDIRALVDRARFWLDTREPGPFFMYLHVMNVHGPYRAPPEYRERFLEEPWEDFPFQNPLWKDIAERNRVERRSEVTPEQLRDLRARYDGAIAYTDEVLGSFVEDLSTRGVLDQSVLLITSDHGEELFDHGSFGHRRTLHGELLDVPLLIRLPGGRGGGSRIAEPVSLIDVPATLLALGDPSGAPAGAGFGRGRSLAPLLAGAGDTVAARPLLAELVQRDGLNAMVELWPYRMIDMVDAPGAQLYRVDLDARESRDLAADEPAQLERLSELRARMLPDAAGPAAGEPATRDRELQRQLEALGYVDDGGEASADE